MRSKGFVFIFEAIIALITLFVVFNIFFRVTTHKSRWDEALLHLSGRDIILAIDRNEKLYEYSFDFSSLHNFLDGRIVPFSMISWAETEGAIKNSITIACDCPGNIISELGSWTKNLMINGRKIDFTIIPTTLSQIEPSDVLIIWGYKDLSNYVNSLRNYLEDGGGIVEVADLGPPLDFGQTEIFGITHIGGSPLGILTYDEFPRKPRNSSETYYIPYKNFYHIPLPLEANSTSSSIPVDLGSQPFCEEEPQVPKGALKIQVDMTTRSTFDYSFWICNSSLVFFDIDRNGNADTILKEGDDLKISDNYDPSVILNFSINYVRNNIIGISFKSYRFYDFIKILPGPQYEVLSPSDGNDERILLQGNFKTNQNKPVPGVILGKGKTAWVADFTEEGVGDDERLLLISLLLWASNKWAKEIPRNLRVGLPNSYINVYNRDIFEVYSFNLGLGYPY